MEKRDLDKLRKEHKERFGKTKESSRRNSNEMSGSVPPSKRNEEAKPTNEAISEKPATPISFYLVLYLHIYSSPSQMLQVNIASLST